MLILSQSKENLIGDNFVISYESPMTELHMIKYHNMVDNITYTLAKYNTKEDCIEQIEVLQMLLTDEQNIKANKPTIMKNASKMELITMPSIETLENVHKKKGNK